MILNKPEVVVGVAATITAPFDMVIFPPKVKNDELAEEAPLTVTLFAIRLP